MRHDACLCLIIQEDGNLAYEPLHSCSRGRYVKKQFMEGIPFGLQVCDKV